MVERWEHTKGPVTTCFIFFIFWCFMYVEYFFFLGLKTGDVEMFSCTVLIRETYTRVWVCKRVVSLVVPEDGSAAHAPTPRGSFPWPLPIVPRKRALTLEVPPLYVCLFVLFLCCVAAVLSPLLVGRPVHQRSGSRAGRGGSHPRAARLQLDPPSVVLAQARM